METTDIHSIDDGFRIIADTVPVLLWLGAQDKSCIYLNKEWEHYTGRSIDQLLGFQWVACIHPDDLASIQKKLDLSFDSSAPFEFEYRLKRHDGSYRHFLAKGLPRFNSSGTFMGYSGCCMDVEDRHQLNALLEHKVEERTEQLRRQKDMLEKVINASLDILIVYDRDYNFLTVNQAAKTLYKMKDDPIGRNLFDLYPTARGSQGHQDLERAFSGETVHNPIYRSAVADAYFEDYLIPLNDETGAVYAVMLIARDISEHIKAEEELKSENETLADLNAKLQSSNEDLASFNYVASHDLQEPLRKVSIFASRILENEKNTLNGQSLQYFDRINSAITRMQNLISALLEYSRAESSEIKRSRISLGKIIREVLLSLDETIKAKQAVIEVAELPSLYAVPVQMHQLFQNLISNSLKYAKPDAPPQIRISAEEVTDQENENRPYCKISVADNGIGFNMEYRQKIFELFQRLHGKTDIEGTGVGLAICRKIANNHSGFITADSTPGKGSVFSVYLPAKK